MVALVLVSHSPRLADGCRELAGQIAGGDVRIEVAAGDPGGGLGTTSASVSYALGRAHSEDGTLVLCDLGSAVLAARHALNSRDGGFPAVIADAPFVEGAVAAAISAAGGASLDEA